MCSDVGNGETEDSKVKNRDGEAEFRDLVSERGLHLNDVLDVLVSFDEPGIFMDPVDDSFAPNYSKIIKTPMCFSTMREKICSWQYMSWRSFLEDFERICYNAMKYNQKRSKIWNAANALLCQGKEYLEQQATKSERILGICKKMEEGDTIENMGSLVQVKLEEPCEAALVKSFLQEKPMKTGLEKYGVANESVEACHGYFKEQGHGAFSTNFFQNEGGAFSTNFFQNEGGVPVLADFELCSGKQQDEEQKGVLDGPSAPSSKSYLTKGLAEEVMVDIIGCTVAEDGRLDSEDQATECSSSFEGTLNDTASCATFDVGEDGSEVESLLRDGNGAMVPSDDGSGPHKRKKAALTSEWKTHRRGIEWRCRWLELRVKQLQAQSAGYDEILSNIRSKRQQVGQDCVGFSSARTSYLADYSQKKQILQRRRRRKVEEMVDLSSFMSRHPIFSRYEKRTRRDNEGVSTEEAYGEQNQPIYFDLADLTKPEDQDIEELSEGCIAGQDSMEQLLWDIEALQMHVMKLKSLLSRGTLTNKKPSKFSFKDMTLSSPQSSSHLSQLVSPRSYRSSMHVHSPGIQLGSRPSSGSKLHSSSIISRRRNSDYDINNVVMPGNVMATYVEPARHVFIETPQWRVINDHADLEERSSSEEDTSDEIYSIRHADMEIKEREHRYTPSSSLSTPGGKVGVKGLSRTCGKGSILSHKGVTAEHLHVPPFTSFACVPKRKRRKRESQISHFTAKKFEHLIASFPEPLQGFVQGQAVIKTEDGDVTNAVSVDTSDRQTSPVHAVDGPSTEVPIQ